MDRVISIIAPRGVFDYIARMVVLLLAVGLLNWLRESVMAPEEVDGFWRYFIDAAVVGFPFFLGALALLAHQQRLQEKLALQAQTDTLTGLPNRRAFFERICRLEPDQLAEDGTMLMIDVDHFKSINDHYGHLVGDQCLETIAAFIRADLRPTEDVGRLGGEEFCIYTSGDAARVRDLSARVAAGVQISAPFPAPRQVTMSVGMAQAAAGTGLRLILTRADHALYAAKSQGRARAVMWSEHLTTPARGAAPVIAVPEPANTGDPAADPLRHKGQI